MLQDYLAGTFTQGLFQAGKESGMHFDIFLPEPSPKNCTPSIPSPGGRTQSPVKASERRSCYDCYHPCHHFARNPVPDFLPSSFSHLSQKKCNKERRKTGKNGRRATRPFFVFLVCFCEDFGSFEQKDAKSTKDFPRSNLCFICADLWLKRFSVFSVVTHKNPVNKGAKEGLPRRSFSE